MIEEDFPDALPPGHRLHWYVLERVLGQGGFGITYLALDSNLQRHVAIKEYLPAEVARRRSDASARPRTESHTERFAWGLERFLAEARTLARFDHPNIVRVLSIFEANSTAYMVMRFEEGESLGTLLDRRERLPQREITDLLLPVLAGLQLVHSSGFIHRDIKPENIYVRDDGSPVLLDFGSARQSFGNAKAMTILVAPGYAPLEQYYGDAATQGPWTDIYGLAATCYRAVTGRPPLDAVARAKGVLGSTRDLLEPAAVVGQGEYDASLLAAIDHGLQLSERDRPQSIVEWRRELVAPSKATVGQSSGAGGDGVAPVGTAATTGASAPPAPESAEPKASSAFVNAAAPKPKTWRRWAGAAALCAGLTLVVLTLRTVDAPVPASHARAPMEARPSSVTTGMVAPPAGPLGTSQSAPVMASSPPPPQTGPATPPSQVARQELAAPPARDSADRHPVNAPGTSAAQERAELTARRSALASSALPRALVPPSSSSTPLTAALPTRSATPAGADLIAAAPVALAASVARSAPVAVLASASSAGLATRRREEQLDAAEAALRRGDASGAILMATPWASAGVARAQTLLGRAQEARSKEQQNDFEAYVWYSIAARNGEPAAPALRDKVASRLQPAEIRQADQISERWKPRPEAAGEATPERSAP